MTVLAVLENTLRSFCWSYKIQDKEATILTVLAVMAVMAVMALSVITATPLKLNPPFPLSRYLRPLRSNLKLSNHRSRL